MIIYLTGFMGSGKSAVGWQLKKLLSYPMIDMDEEIEKREGRRISEIFDTDGEAYFRDVETEVLRELSGRELLLISCGGGIPIREENRKIMKEHGKTVYLTAEPETVALRLEKDTSRPLLQNRKGVEEIRTMMESRRAAYEDVADLTLATDDLTPKELAERIRKEFFTA